MQSGKTSYRGLGSIDFRAAARSVLIVGRLKDNPNVRIVAHDKSNLAYAGSSIVFELSKEKGFEWKGFSNITSSELVSGVQTHRKKSMIIEDEIIKLLEDGSVESSVIFSKGKEIGVSERTIKTAKKNLNIKSFKKGKKWFWSI